MGQRVEDHTLVLPSGTKQGEGPGRATTDPALGPFAAPGTVLAPQTQAGAHAGPVSEARPVSLGHLLPALVLSFKALLLTWRGYPLKP